MSIERVEGELSDQCHLLWLGAGRESTKSKACTSLPKGEKEGVLFPMQGVVQLCSFQLQPVLDAKGWYWFKEKILL